MNTSDIYHLIAIVGVAVGATWALRSKLDDVKNALFDHAKEDAEHHADHEARIIKLEGRKRR